MGDYSDILTSAFELGCFYSSFTNEQQQKKRLNKIYWFSEKIRDNVSRDIGISLNAVVEYVKDTNDIGSFFLPELLEWRKTHNEYEGNIYIPQGHVAIFCDSENQRLPTRFRQESDCPLYPVLSTTIDFSGDRIFPLTDIQLSNDLLVHGGELTCLYEREDGVQKMSAIIRQLYGIDLLEKYSCPPEALQEQCHRFSGNPKKMSEIFKLYEELIDENGLSKQYVKFLKVCPGKKKLISMTDLSWNALERLGIKPDQSIAFVLGELKNQEIHGSRQSAECAEYALSQMVSKLKQRRH